jgi:septal ring factor EnvC (AmiA/AmiB activator)
MNLKQSIFETKQQTLGKYKFTIAVLFSMGFSTALPLVFPNTVSAQEADIILPDNQSVDLELNRTETSAELEAILTEAEKTKNALSRLETNIASFKKDQSLLETQLIEAETRQNLLDEKIVLGEQKLADLKQDETEIKTSLIARNSVLAEVLAALQRLGGNPPPALLVSPEDALSSVRSAILLGAVVPEIRAETEKLAIDLQQLTNIRKNITSEREQLAQALQDSFEDETQLTQLIQEKAALNIASLQQLEKERNRADELDNKSNELQTVIASLNTEILTIKRDAEEARLIEIERRRKADAQLARAKQLADAANSEDRDLLTPAYSFSALQATLSLPTEGAVVRMFGEIDSLGEPLQGVLLASSEKSTVLAPIDGWVLYSGDYRSYGQILIIDAGEGYQLVLAGMDKLSVSEGQFVLSGEPIATMGQPKATNNNGLTLASGKPSLYIELRKDQKPIDSAPWWASLASGRASNDT